MAVLDDRAVDLRAENAELRRRLDEALAQQQAAAEILQLINASGGDLQPVFDALLEKAMRLCGAAFGSLVTFDGERFHNVAHRGVPPALADNLREPLYPTPGASFERLVRGEAIVHIADIADTEAYRSGYRGRVALVEKGGARTAIWVALRRDDTLLGTLVIYRQEVRPFSDREIALLQNFAAQAVIAMENARLITETREALEQQTATAEVLGVINASPGDLGPVFDAMLEKALRLCGADLGNLLTYDGECFEAVVGVYGTSWAGPERELSRAPIRPAPGGLLDRLIGGEHFIYTENVRTEFAYQRSPDFRELVDGGGYQSMAHVALRKEGQLLGAIVIFFTQQRSLTEKQIALLQNFAAQAVIAMENARLITETREALEQQTATAEVLQVINASPGDLGPVFDAMLEKALRLCGITLGTLQLNEAGKFYAVAVRGASEPLGELLRQPVEPLPGTPPSRLMAGECFVQIADIAEFAKQHPEDPRAPVVADQGVHTVAFIPLRMHSDLLGYLAVFRNEVRPFSDKEIALLQNFAAQAVIAMENARLLTETREALEQQTATAEVLGVINASPGDLAPVFHAMLEKAMRLCQAAFGIFLVRDGSRFRTAAQYGVPAALAEFLSSTPREPGKHTAVGRMLDGEDFVQFEDFTKEPAYEAGDPRQRAFVELGGARTYVAVALRKDGELVGTIAAYRSEVRPFSERQIALLQNFAQQAVIAMENARLITETREALEQQTATAEVLQVINSSPGDLAPVFDAILEKAHSLCGAEIGALLTYDGQSVRLAAERNLPPAWANVVRGPWLPRHDHPVMRIIRGERLFQIEDMAEIARTSDDPVMQAAIELGGIRSLLLVPLRKDGAFLGYITAYRQEVRPFTEKQIALLENFAAQAVIAMENARLLGELRQRTDEVAELNRGLEARVAEQVEELGRVGKLKRFLAPQLAELIVSQGDENILESHRREIVVVFCDLRGFTAFAETAEPEEVLELLREYHAALGPLVGEFEGTLDHFSGDGIMVFFNDPVPCPDPAERAVRMAVAMRAAASELIALWRRRGRDLGFGVGIAQGYATLGQIGFADRSDYTAIGTVCNLAARLCAEAKDGQILLARRVAAAVEGTVALEEIGTLSLKGLAQPVAAFNVLAEGAA